MYYLPRVVVNPPSLQGDIVCTHLDRNVLYGTNRDRKVGYNVITAQIMVGVEPNIERKVKCEADEKVSIRHTLAEYRQMIEAEKSPNRNSAEETLSDIQLRIVVALANHQVNGDQLMKGLKAQGIHLDVKFQESFLGGWNISNVEGEILDLEDILRMIPS